MTQQNGDVVGDLVTPCCGVPFYINYVYVGNPYMSDREVDTLECSNCDNEWDREGGYLG